MEKLFKELRENWVIYAFLIAMTLWYGSTNDRITAVEAQVTQQETTLDKINQLSIDMAVVKTDVHNIKEALKVK